ncbi:LytTR family DNA-binding domain-containing protein [bacterium]|nr:LytTR family DNA-binding domain-containing protein [bacterium]
MAFGGRVLRAGHGTAFGGSRKNIETLAVVEDESHKKTDLCYHGPRERMFMAINVGLCDDEANELDRLERFVAGYGEKRAVVFQTHRFLSGEELLESISAGQAFDLLFLDIYMNGADGIEVARKVRETGAAGEIIFATSSAEHAVNGYQVRAIQYLLKPLADEELIAAMDQALETLALRSNRCILIQNRSGSYRIPLKEIVFAESNAKIVRIHTLKDGSIEYYDRLDNFERQCGDQRFLRCHKSFLVNLDFAYSIQENAIRLFTGEDIRISMSVSEARKIFTRHAARRLTERSG